MSPRSRILGNLRLASLLAAANTMQTAQALDTSLTLRVTRLPAPLAMACHPGKQKAQWKRERQGR
jgi:hypothetical protein